LPPGGLPPEVQAALLEKVFLFDPALGNKSSILVVFADENGGQAARRLVEAFRGAGLTAEAASAAAAADRVPQVGAVYFLGAADDRLRSLCVKHHRLSVAGSAALAETGRVAVAVDVNAAGNPEIVVHRGRLAEEGHRLEPRLLKLARLVG
jgi:hypothetical protein